MDVVAIEDSSTVVVEASEGHSRPGIPMTEVRDAQHDCSLRGEPVAKVHEDSIGIAHVLEDVCGHHDVVAATHVL